MKLSALSILLRPRSVGETIDLALVFIRLHANIYAKLTCFALLVPGILLYAWLASARVDSRVGWALIFIWGSLMQGLFTVAAADRLFSGHASPLQLALRFGRGMINLIVLLVLTRVVACVYLATLALSFRSYPVLIYAHEVALLEGQRGWTALTRCHRLSKLHLGTSHIFALYLGVGGLSVVLLSEYCTNEVLKALFQISLTEYSLAITGISLPACLAYLALMPIVATARLLLYIHERAKQDGWDIQIRFQSLLSQQEGSP